MTLSLRRRRVIAAPTISNTRPTAASGTRTGAMSSAAGRIRPTAARTSRTPMALTAPALKSSTHPPPGLAANFSLGRISLATPAARKITANSPAAIHRARSIRFSLRSRLRAALDGAVEASTPDGAVGVVGSQAQGDRVRLQPWPDYLGYQGG